MKHLFLFCTFVFCLSSLHAQNVGIGTTNPTKGKLEVFGASIGGNTSAIFGTDGAGISLQRNVSAIGFNEYHFNFNKYMTNGYAAVQFLDHVNGGMYFDLYNSGIADNNVPAGIRALSLHANGNVGVRGGSNQASLTVARGTGIGGTAMFGGTTHISHFNFDVAEHTYIRAGKNGSNVYLNDIPFGKVLAGINLGDTKFGINTENPIYTLDVVQSGGTGLRLINPTVGYHNWELSSQLFGYTPLSTMLQLDYDGSPKGYFKPTDGSYTLYSDSRLKTNIIPLPPLLDKVMKLQPSEYEMKFQNPTHQKSFGFIAQEVKLLFPEMVDVIQDTSRSYEGITDLHAINYTGFSVLAIKAIQEQQKIIDELKARLEKLEKLLTIKE